MNSKQLPKVKNIPKTQNNNVRAYYYTPAKNETAHLHTTPRHTSHHTYTSKTTTRSKIRSTKIVLVAQVVVDAELVAVVVVPAV